MNSDFTLFPLFMFCESVPQINDVMLKYQLMIFHSLPRRYVINHAEQQGIINNMRSQGVIVCPLDLSTRPFAGMDCDSPRALRQRRRVLHDDAHARRQEGLHARHRHRRALAHQVRPTIRSPPGHAAVESGRRE